VSTKLFVGSLPWSVNDDKLKEAFEEHGNVVSAKVVMDRTTGRSRGFGFVEMGSADDAQKAIKALNDSELGGRNIVVNEAKSRD
jgi:cold-inducible RNA-binding protein